MNLRLILIHYLIAETCKNKSLKKQLLVTVSCQILPKCRVITDGGALLWSNDWSRNELFQEIYENYVRLRFNLKVKLWLSMAMLLQLKMLHAKGDPGRCRCLSLKKFIKKN